MVKRSLTPKTFYRALFSGVGFLGLLILISILSSNSSLMGYAVVGESANQEKGYLSPEFIPCPLTYNNEACIRGNNLLIKFSSPFRIVSINGNALVDTSISFGNQLTCIYESREGNRYRLTGKFKFGERCRAMENGFWCG